MPNDGWITELAEVHLQTHDLHHRHVILNLCLINDVAFLREVSRDWTEKRLRYDGQKPEFNWIAIYNFNVSENAHAFAIKQGSRTEAVMLVKDGHVVRCDRIHRPPAVYVSFVEVALWNRADTPPELRLRGVGTAILRAACDLSMQRGFYGRVGLHAIAAAEGFYRRLGFEAYDCPNEYNEIYYELSERGAEALLTD